MIEPRRSKTAAATARIRSSYRAGRSFLGRLIQCGPISESPSGTYALIDDLEARASFQAFDFEFLFVPPDGREGEVFSWSETISIDHLENGE